MRFWFSYIEKDKYAENLVDKLCQRLKNAYDVRLWRDVSYCLSLLPYNTERTLKKLIDNAPLYQDKIHDDFFHKCFCDIIGKARKAPRLEAKSSLDELEQRIEAWHAERMVPENGGGEEGEDVVMATQDSENVDPNAVNVVASSQSTPAKQNTPAKNVTRSRG